MWSWIHRFTAGIPIEKCNNKKQNMKKGSEKKNAQKNGPEEGHKSSALC